MANSLLSRHVTWSKATEALLEAEIQRGRFANISEAVRAAVWNSFGHETARRELERLIDEALDDPRLAVSLVDLKKRGM